RGAKGSDPSSPRIRPLPKNPNGIGALCNTLCPDIGTWRIGAMKRLLAIGLFCLSLSFPARAQTTNATISGTVLDPQKAVVAGAPITAVNTGTGLMTTTTTNDAGVYVFPSIQPGLYRLTAEAANFRMYVVNDINVEVGARLNINVALTLAETSTAV